MAPRSRLVFSLASPLVPQPIGDQRLRMILRTLLITVGLLAAIRAQAQPSELQHPELRISNFAKQIESAGDEQSQLIKVEVQHEGRDRWELVTQKQLQEYQRASTPLYEVYYKYDQSLLVPSPQPPCYLYVWIVDPRESSVGDDGQTRSWSQKYRLTVTGNYVDQTIQLPISVQMQGTEQTGTLDVVAHQKFPSEALSPQEKLEIEVPTNRVTPHELSFARRSTCCAIELLEANAEKEDEELWKDVKFEGSKLLPSQGPKDYQPWLSLKVLPQASNAFWRSFVPFSEENPHARLTYKVRFKVDGGREAFIKRPILVRFKPSFSNVVISVILGALVAAMLSLLVVGLRRGPEPVFGEAQRFQARAREVAKRVVLSITMALIVFFFYFFIKGDKKVILFDYPLDPTQCIPAFLIGLLVGSRPAWYYEKLTKIGEKGEKKDPPAVTAVLLVFLGWLGCAALPLESQTGFRPESLDYDTGSDTLYVLSSFQNRVYSLDLPQGRMQEIARLDPSSKVMDLCLVPLGGSLWFATVGNSLLSSSGIGKSTVLLTPTKRGLPIRRLEVVGFWSFVGVTFDEINSRLLITDDAKESIYEARVSPSGLSKLSLAFSDPQLREPTLITARKGRVFVASRKNGAVYEVDFKTHKLRQLAGDISDVAALLFTPERPKLLIADGAEAVVWEHDLTTSRNSKRISDKYLREPRAVQIDKRGHVWVGDAWAQALLEFTSDEGPPKRYSP